MQVACGPPRGREEPMSQHYRVATEPSRLIVGKVYEETDCGLGAHYYKVKEEPGV